MKDRRLDHSSNSLIAGGMNVTNDDAISYSATDISPPPQTRTADISRAPTLETTRKSYDTTFVPEVLISTAKGPQIIFSMATRVALRSACRDVEAKPMMESSPSPPRQRLQVESQ